MGMYNNIKGKFKLKCCGKMGMDFWQGKDFWLKTKSGEDIHIENALYLLNISDIYEGEFYNYCSNCKKKTTYYIKNGKIVKDKYVIS